MDISEPTVEEPSGQEDGSGEQGLCARPGLILVYSGGQPAFEILPLKNGQLEIGRGDGQSGLKVDPRMSRRHARVCHDGQRFQIEDLGSQNGSFVDGKPLEGKLLSTHPQVLRTGESLFLLRSDLGPYSTGKMRSNDGTIIGPILQQILDQIAHFILYSGTLHITGESGSGKEVAARVFHAAGPHRSGPYVAVNCAAIPEGVAERVLFGAKRGAFSGAVADSDGYIPAADGGTLFLDEITELDLAVQAKLLRVLETQQVYQLGSTRAKEVKLFVCSACNKNLREEVRAGRFREDLFFRLSSPEIAIPPLRERREEIPWLIAQVLKELGGEVTSRTTFVESCLLRHWPGNVRELLRALRAAVPRALASKQTALQAQHLDPMAGMAFGTEPRLKPLSMRHEGDKPSRETIEQVLKHTSGNVSAAARLLGQHRNQIQRQIDRLGIDPEHFSAKDAEE